MSCGLAYNERNMGGVTRKMDLYGVEIDRRMAEGMREWNGD